MNLPHSSFEARAPAAPAASGRANNDSNGESSRADGAANNNNNNNEISWRQLSLDRGPVAPLAARVTAPFADSDQKKAITVARYYAECHLNGIDPIHADFAADEAQRNYENWWVGMTALQNNEDRELHKRRKVKQIENESSSDSVSVCGEVFSSQSIPPHPFARQETVQLAKQGVVESLKANGGDTTTCEFLAAMDVLYTEYSTRGCDARWWSRDSDCILDGMWLDISKPTFSGCIGKKRDNEYCYRLGRLSFDMFRPTQLMCSIQGCFNIIQKLDSSGLNDTPLPLRLFALRQKSSCVRRYDISESLTVESLQTRDGKPETQAKQDEYVVPRPLKGVISSQGFCVPDPGVPNRLSVWFIGGKLQVEVENDLEEWKRVFDQSMAPRRETKAMAQFLAAKLLLGASVPEKLGDDGTMSYQLNRPIGGHGSAYVDVVYCDESLRILRGHQGSIYVSIRSL